MLGTSLIIVFLIFCAVMAGVLAYCIRERKFAQRDGHGENITTATQMEQHDKRIVIVLFGAIIVGALLALITGYLVFFRTWS